MLEERTAHVALDGPLDVYRVGEIESLLPPVGSIDRLVLDLTNVSAVDSTVLTALLRYRRRFEEAGHSGFNIVAIVNENGRRIFDISGLSRVMTVISPANK